MVRCDLGRVIWWNEALAVNSSGTSPPLRKGALDASASLGFSTPKEASLRCLYSAICGLLGKNGAGGAMRASIPTLIR